MKKFCLLSLIYLSSILALSAGDPYCDSKGAVSYDECESCDNSGYLFAYGGVSFGFEFDFEDVFGGGAAEFDTGYILGAGVGVESDFLCGSRFEIELLQTGHEFGSIDLDSPVLSVTLGASATGKGLPILIGNSFNVETRAVLVNLLKTCSIGCFDVYAGGGFGVAELRITEADSFIFQDSSSSTFAYQFKAGIDLPVSDCLSLFTEYKYLGLTSTSVTSFGQDIDIDGYNSHNIVFGARIAF